MFDQLHLNLDSHACVVGIACEVQCLPSKACSIAGCIVVESLLLERMQVSVSPRSRYYNEWYTMSCTGDQSDVIYTVYSSRCLMREFLLNSGKTLNPCCTFSWS